jgi:hypothetical protein
VVIEFCAGFQDEGFLLGIKGAFTPVVAGFAERIPILALLDTFQIPMAMCDFFKKAFLGEIVPVLTLTQGNGLAKARNSTPPAFADYGKIPVAENLSFFEPHLSGPDGVRKGNQEDSQQKQQARIHICLLL